MQKLFLMPFLLGCVGKSSPGIAFQGYIVSLENMLPAFASKR